MTDNITEERLVDIKRSVGTADMDLISGHEILAMASLALQSLRSAQAGEVEVVAHAEVLAGRVTAVRVDKSRHCTDPLITLASHQSLIAAKDDRLRRYEAFEVELFERLQAAEARANAAVVTEGHIFAAMKRADELEIALDADEARAILTAALGGE